MEDTSPNSLWLNYHHLRYFHSIAQESSLRKAADKLRISQPAISAQVKLLETALGGQLLRRSGRSLALTDFGQLIYAYADEIFMLGRELLSTAKQGPGGRLLRLSVGIVDSFPKLLSLDVLRPVLAHEPPVLLACHEGKLDDLIAQLAAHRLDAVLADEPPPSTAKVKAFNHPLGSSGITFCAEPALARRLKGRFPNNLHNAPALLPTQNTALRRDLEKWFRSVDVQPRVVAEFEDAALAKIVATEGTGFTTVPTIVAAEAIERYGFIALGRTEEIQAHLFLITAERRLEHPAVLVLARRSVHEIERRKRKNASKAKRRK